MILITEVISSIVLLVSGGEAFSLPQAANSHSLGKIRGGSENNRRRSHRQAWIGLMNTTASSGERLLRSLSEEESSEEDNDVEIDDSKRLPVEFIAETNLPTDMGHFRLRAYRIHNAPKYHGTEPCLIYPSDRTLPCSNVPVRIHDQCLTSEVFRSQRCDCKEQLKESLEYILKHGGAVIYLQQEGRGIGLANKVAAYALQDTGMDTVDANIHLGFPEDNRSYGVVPSILEDMNIRSIQLLTNNPRKVKQLKALGVNVTKSIPIASPRFLNRYNLRYLTTKVQKMNHQSYRDVLPGIVPGTSTSHNLDVNGVMAAQRAISSAFNHTIHLPDSEDEPSTTLTLHSIMPGVIKNPNGYCFGRQSVEAAIAAVKNGEIIVVVDDMDRENEGDFIIAADKITPHNMAKIIRFSSGVVCVGMEGDRMDDLNLPAMVQSNQDPKGTAFSVSVDAIQSHGITTGISASERATTIKLLSSPTSKHTDFSRPGHIFPLRAKPNGVLSRDGHTEAAVDFARLAGSSPVGVLCEIVSEENPTEMARLPELARFCQRHGFVLTSIADLIQYRKDTGL